MDIDLLILLVGVGIKREAHPVLRYRIFNMYTDINKTLMCNFFFFYLLVRLTTRKREANRDYTGATTSGPGRDETV